MKRKNPAAVSLGKRRMAGMSEEDRKAFGASGGAACWDLTPKARKARISALADARRLAREARKGTQKAKEVKGSPPGCPDPIEPGSAKKRYGEKPLKLKPFKGVPPSATNNGKIGFW